MSSLLLTKKVNFYAQINICIVKDDVSLVFLYL